MAVDRADGARRAWQAASLSVSVKRELISRSCRNQNARSSTKLVILDKHVAERRVRVHRRRRLRRRAAGFLIPLALRCTTKELSPAARGAKWEKGFEKHEYEALCGERRGYNKGFHTCASALALTSLISRAARLRSSARARNSTSSLRGASSQPPRVRLQAWGFGRVL